MGQLVQFPVRSAATVDPWHRAPSVHPDQVEVTLEQDAEQSLSYALGTLAYGAWGLLNVASCEAINALRRTARELATATGAERRRLQARHASWYGAAADYLFAMGREASTQAQRDITQARYADLDRANRGLAPHYADPDGLTTAGSIAELPF